LDWVNSRRDALLGVSQRRAVPSLRDQGPSPTGREDLPWSTAKRWGATSLGVAVVAVAAGGIAWLKSDSAYTKWEAAVDPIAKEQWRQDTRNWDWVATGSLATAGLAVGVGAGLLAYDRWISPAATGVSGLSGDGNRHDSGMRVAAGPKQIALALTF